MTVIISDDFVDLGTITSITEEASYPADNVEEYWHMKRRFRATGVPKSDVDFLLKFNFGEAKSAVAVVLNDVNFDRTRIRAHTADLGNNWAGSLYDCGQNYSIGRDERVGRYKIYIPVTFDMQWMVVQVPAIASAVGDYTTKWEVGSVVVLATAPNCSKNAYSRTSGKPFEDLSLPYGGFERVGLGDNLAWSGTITIDTRAEADENEFWQLNEFDSGKPHIFYENEEDDSKVYLCLRDNNYEGTLVHRGLITGNSIKFKELV